MLDREFFLGLIKIHILYHASKGPIFVAEITDELGQHGMAIISDHVHSILLPASLDYQNLNRSYS